MRDNPEWPGKLKHRGRGPNRGLDSSGKKGLQKFVMKEELNG
jgi:hypothetical protein